MARKPSAESDSGDELEYTVSTDESGQPRRPSKLLRKVLFGAGAVIFVFFFYVAFIYHPTKPGKKEEATDNAAPSSSALNAGVPGQAASVAALGAQQQKTNTEIQSLKAQLAAIPEQNKKEFQYIQDSLDQKMNDLTQQIQNQQDKLVESARSSGTEPSAASAGASQSPVTSTSAGGTGHQFPYQPLYSGGVSVAAASNGSSGNLLSGMPSLNIGSNGQQSQNANSADKPAPATTQSPGNSATASPKAPAQNTATIPALSFVRVTLLHGVDCPVQNSPLGNAGGSGSGTDTNTSGLGGSDMPVVMPIDGKWYGPNKHVYSIGNAFLFGLCTGQEVEGRPTAVVKLERLSYVGPDGVAQYIPINGYVIDRRDHTMGIRGVLESQKGEQIADASKAAAIAALGNLGLQSGSTTSINPLGGAITSITNLGKSAVGSAFSAAATQISTYYANRALQSVDVVSVPSGIPLEIINTQPIVYQAGPVKNPVASDSSDPPY